TSSNIIAELTGADNKCQRARRRAVVGAAQKATGKAGKACRQVTAGHSVIMVPYLFLVTGLVMGGLLGGIVGWLLRARRRLSEQTIQPLQPLVEELRANLAGREARLIQLQNDLATAKSMLAAAQATQQAAEKTAKDQQDTHGKALGAACENQINAETQLARVRSELSDEKTLHAGARARLGEIERALSDTREWAKQTESSAALLREQLVAVEKKNS